MSTVTQVRDLQPGDRFYRLRTMERYTYAFPCSRKKYRHFVMAEGANKPSGLHGSCHVKRIMRASTNGRDIYCCHHCFKKSGSMFLSRMIVCPECGNKRCPKASEHRLKCAGSNEPGQAGSVYA